MKFNFFLSKAKKKQNQIIIKIFKESTNIDFTFNTSLQIDTGEWDHEKQRPKNIYLKKHKQLNSILDNIKIQIAEYITKKLNNKEFPSQRALSKKIKTLCFLQKVDHPKDSLLYFMEMYISSRKELICISTHKRYHVFCNLILRFEGAYMKKLYLEDTNMDFVNRFIVFGKEENYSENTIYRTIHFIKTVLNFVEKKGIKTWVREIEVRKEKQQREIVTLSEFEIKQIINTKIPAELKIAKDWLLISCYMGQRVSDFMRFNNNQLVDINGIKCINFVQQKTKKNIRLPLHPIVIDILERNGNSFPPPLDSRVYNSQIKQIAFLAQLNQLVKTNKRIMHRAINLSFQKWEVITSHIGRRSFATNFYGKIPTPLLMAATGHSTERMFLHYINPNDEKKIVSLGDYFNSLHNELG